MLHLGNAGQLGLQPLLLLSERKTRRCVQLLEAPASFAIELQQVGVVLPGRGEAQSTSLRYRAHHDMFFQVERLLLPQRRSVRDGQQRDASIFSSLENLSLHVDAHSAGTLIQQSIFRPDM